MRKVTSDEFFGQLLKNASFPNSHTSDAVYDIGTIKEAEKSDEPYHFEIFYRESGTWLVNHKCEHTPEDQGIETMKENSLFSMEYEKRPRITKWRGKEFDYYLSSVKECAR